VATTGRLIVMTGKELAKSMRWQMQHAAKFHSVRKDLTRSLALVCATLVLAILVAAIQIDHIIKRNGITQYDRVQLHRLFDSVDY
jgi:hypothetical protein